MRRERRFVNSTVFSSWQLWAVLSAIFAALTAIFAKVGVANINSDLATFIRTCVILLTLALIVYATGQFENPTSIAPRTYLFLVLSGLATGASCLLLPRAQARQRLTGRPCRQAQRRAGRNLGALLLDEKLTMLNWLGVALIALGAVLVAL